MVVSALGVVVLRVPSGAQQASPHQPQVREVVRRAAAVRPARIPFHFPPAGQGEERQVQAVPVEQRAAVRRGCQLVPSA